MVFILIYNYHIIVYMNWHAYSLYYMTLLWFYSAKLAEYEDFNCKICTIWGFQMQIWHNLRILR